MAAQIRPGDLVRLKSGGPLMTVDSLFEDWEAVTAECFWFEGTTIKRNRFKITSLIKGE